MKLPNAGIAVSVINSTILSSASSECPSCVKNLVLIVVLKICSFRSMSPAALTVLADMIAPASRASFPNSLNPAALFFSSGTSAVASDAIASIKNVKSC